MNFGVEKHGENSPFSPGLVGVFLFFSHQLKKNCPCLVEKNTGLSDSSLGRSEKFAKVEKFGFEKNGELAFSTKLDLSVG